MAKQRVWDLPTRIFHWTLVLVCLTMVITGQLGLLRVHMVVGPAALALVLFRLVWGFIGSTTSRFSAFIKGPRTIISYIQSLKQGQPWPGIGHNPLGALSVVALLGLPVLMVGTGLFASDDVVSDGPLVGLVSSATVKLMTRLHHTLSSVVLLVVVVHVTAVLSYLYIKKDNLIVPMITGHKATETVSMPPLRFVNSWRALPIAVVVGAIVWGGLWILSASAK